MRRIDLLILWPLVATALPFGANVVDRYDGRKRDDVPAYIGLAQATAVVGVTGAIGGTVVHESIKGVIGGVNGMVQNKKARRRMKLEEQERSRLQKLADQRAKTEWSREKLNQKSQCISDTIAMVSKDLDGRTRIWPAQFNSILVSRSLVQWPRIR